MEINDVIKAVHTLKKYENKSFVTMTELAKALSVKKVALMAFVDEHTKHFWLQQRWEPKMKTVYFQPSWSAKKIKEQVQVRGKNLGICIKEAYLDIYQNPCNREHIQYLQEKHIKSLYVTRIDYYSSEPLGYRILQHTEPKDWELYSERKDLYLNTAKKLNEIKKIVELKNQRFTFGGFGDSYSQELSNVITAQDLEKLQEAGWNLINYKNKKQI